MTRIHYDKVNKLAEWNLLHDIINPPKLTKNVRDITLLLYMDILILEEVDRILRTFEYYRIVYIYPIL